MFDEATADFRYARLHGADELYASGYTADALDAWAKRVRAWLADGDVFVYFDNDAKVHAPYDALALAATAQLTRLVRSPHSFSRSSNFCTLPVDVLGSASTISTSRGAL